MGIINQLGRLPDNQLLEQEKQHTNQHDFFSYRYVYIEE